MERFELDPLGTNQKSFYGKARVERINTATGSVYNLYSYDTIVARVSYTLRGTAPYDIESSSFFVYNLQSATTIKHIKAFMHFIYKAHGLNFFVRNGKRWSHFALTTEIQKVSLNRSNFEV